jgi:stearoyl-CoA desaturase (delta-9 desaturase)
LIVFGPLLGVAWAVVRFWNHGISALDLLLIPILYAISGHGVTVGYHRLLTHRGFKVTRWLKICLVVAGSLAFEGSPIAWVANHRMHHSYADREGDPHSPVPDDFGARAQLAGLWHAHVGWLFTASPAPIPRFAADLQADADLRLISSLFPLFCVVSLGLPFGIAWAWTGQLSAGFTALLWAGAVRIFLLHHMTWSVNSICHTYGRRPFNTPNVAVLSVLSMGDSWHNAHHAAPSMVRHGVERGQMDSSARIIRVLEMAGWATDVHWPDMDRLNRRRTQIT